MAISFRFAPAKALEAVVWLLARAGQPVDLQTLLKTAYFADIEMLNRHGRPVFGARYRAMNYGPVPVNIYEMLKGEPYWLTEIEQDDYPWKRVGRCHVGLRNGSTAPAPFENVSDVERELLERAFERCRGMTFDERTRETHGLDWIAGMRRPGGWMAWEDMIDAGHPDRAALIEELEAMGPRLAM